MNALNKKIKNPEECIAYFHIAKCAGTSVRLQLVEDYGAEKIAFFYGETQGKFNFLNEKDFFANRLDLDLDLNKIEILIGHTLTKNIVESFNGNPTLVTVLREPTDRIVSMYYHFLNKRFRKERLPLREIRKLADEVIVRDFSFWFDHLKFEASMLGALYRFETSKKIPRPYDPEKIFRITKKALKKFNFVGVFEEQSSFSKIKEKLKLSNSVGYYNEGNYRKVEKLQEIAQKKILRKWPFEFELYRIAKQL